MTYPNEARRAKRLRKALNEVLSDDRAGMERFGNHIRNLKSEYTFEQVTDAIRGLDPESYEKNRLPVALTHLLWDSLIRRQAALRPDQKRALRYFARAQAKINTLRTDGTKSGWYDKKGNEALRDIVRMKILQYPGIEKTIEDGIHIGRAMDVILRKTGLPFEHEKPLFTSLRMFYNTLNDLKDYKQMLEQGKLPDPAKGLK